LKAAPELPLFYAEIIKLLGKGQVEECVLISSPNIGLGSSKPSMHEEDEEPLF
jgi:hypothetical protein